MRQNGGEIIGVGTYGCVFKPPLKCKKKTRKKKGISKLMNWSTGLDELLITQELFKKLETIPNYKKYVIISKQFCIPDKLSRKDAMQMQRKCDEHIVNDYKNKNELIVHNQPYGGKNLHMVLKETSTLTETEKLATLTDITVKLKDLLLNCINPMHKVNVYHTDIKPHNLVWNKKTIKMIDWGLAVINIPVSHYNIIHFNRPYESILLGLDDSASIEQIEKYIDREFKKYNENILEEPIKNDLLWFFSNPMNELNATTVKKYINMIGREFTKRGKFDKKAFVRNYYKKQDYWGLVYCYIDILRTLNIESNDTKVKILDLCNLMVSGGVIKIKDIVKKMDKVQGA